MSVVSIFNLAIMQVYCTNVGSKNCLDFRNTYFSTRELSAFLSWDDNKLFDNCYHKWYISLLPCIKLYLNFPDHGNGLPVYETSTITDRLITCSCRICFCVLFGFFFFFFFWGYRELNMDCAAAFLACITLAWNNTSQTQSLNIIDQSQHTCSMKQAKMGSTCILN